MIRDISTRCISFSVNAFKKRSVLINLVSHLQLTADIRRWQLSQENRMKYFGQEAKSQKVPIMIYSLATVIHHKAYQAPFSTSCPPHATQLSFNYICII